MEEIRAKHPKYARSIPAKSEDSASSSSTAASDVSVLDLFGFVLIYTKGGQKLSGRACKSTWASHHVNRPIQMLKIIHSDS